jgi:uncharacterized protein YciW
MELAHAITVEGHPERSPRTILSTLYSVGIPTRQLATVAGLGSGFDLREVR